VHQAYENLSDADLARISRDVARDVMDARDQKNLDFKRMKRRTRRLKQSVRRAELVGALAKRTQARRSVSAYATLRSVADPHLEQMLYHGAYAIDGPLKPATPPAVAPAPLVYTAPPVVVMQQQPKYMPVMKQTSMAAVVPAAAHVATAYRGTAATGCHGRRIIATSQASGYHAPIVPQRYSHAGHTACYLTAVPVTPYPGGSSSSSCCKQSSSTARFCDV
jgi:hypothetical protein